MTEKVSKDNLLLDSSWFDSNPDKYLSRDDFMAFQNSIGINLRDLISENLKVVIAAQNEIKQKCIILNEVNKLHFGFTFPLFVYTHCADFCESIPNHNIEADKILLSTDMCDSLRRRHIALSHVLIPNLINELYDHFKEPLIIKNLGSGAGLDVLNAAMNSNGKIKHILNYEIDEKAISIGKTVLKHAESINMIEKDKISFVNKSLTDSNEKCHLAIKVGIICGLPDRDAKILLRKAYNNLFTNGKILVTSSNYNMHSTDPLASFVIQKMGNRENPQKGWALNCRTRDSILNVLKSARFNEIKLYTDSNYEGIDSLPITKLYGIDTFAGKAFNYSQPQEPLSLPAMDVLNKRTGYNWLAIGSK